MKKQQQSYIYALGAILLWSTIAVAFKIGLRDLTPFQLLFNGILVSVFVLFILLIFTGKLKEVFNSRLKDIGWSAFVSLLNPFLYYVVLLEAYDILPAQIAQPLNYTWPIVLVLFSIPLLKQKISWKSILAIIISFMGVVVISVQGNTDFSIKNPYGVMLAVGSSIVWALFWLLNVKDKRDELVKLFFNFVFALLYISILISITSEFKIPKTDSMLASVYVGLFELGITYVLWLKALKLTKTTDKISNLVFISPFLALIWIHLVLKEEIFISTLFGIVLLVSGILLHRIFSKE